MINRNKRKCFASTRAPVNSGKKEFGNPTPISLFLTEFFLNPVTELIDCLFESYIVFPSL